MSGLVANAFNAWGATIVDSLSTLLVMNLTREYSFARTHVRQIDFTAVQGERSAYGAKETGATVPVFESIIRYLGGLISAYDLSGGDQLMLERAEDLAGWLLGAFECVVSFNIVHLMNTKLSSGHVHSTKYGLPKSKYTFGTRLGGQPAGRQVLAEVGSFSLEFGRLAQITGKAEYYDVVSS